MNDPGIPATVAKNKAAATKTTELPSKKFVAKSKIESRKFASKTPQSKDECPAPAARNATNKTSVSKSSSSINTTKSRIPSMKKSILDTVKTSSDQRPTSKRNSPRRIVQQKPPPTKPQTEEKQKPDRLTKIKVTATRSVKSKSDVVPANEVALKSQSARLSSRSERLNLCAKKRSVSNISTHSISCCVAKETTVAAGDGLKAETSQEDAEQHQNESLAIIEPSLEVSGDDDLKCEVEVEKEPSKIDLKETDVKGTSDVQQLQTATSSDILTPVVKESIENKIKQNLEETNKSLKQMEAKYNDLMQNQLSDKLQLEKELRERENADISKKDEDIKELQKKSKDQEKQIHNFKITIQNLEKEVESIQTERDSLREELKSRTDCLATTNKKLQESEQQLEQEKYDVKSKTEIIKKLESEIKKLNNNLAEMATLQAANAALEKEKDKLLQDSADLAKMKEKLLESENKLHELQAECNKKKAALVSVTDYSKEIQQEFANLRQSEVEKQHEIEKLKTELSKTQFSICQMEQQIQRDQQLLDVRSDLINTLQKNEKSHRIHIEDLFAQVAEKNNTINELNCELQMKSEEFRNLCANLSAKQVEVANQEHIVKLLEESNERSKMLRVKQEEKIIRLEEELAHLKQTIAFYQAKVLAANSGSNSLCDPPANVNYNENFYYYVSQRKRKRHIDINVRKYEV